MPNESMEDAIEQLMDHLESIDEAHSIREYNGTVDFTIGEVDLWPRYGADDEINAIRSSSVDFDSLHPDEKGLASQGNPQMGENIHFPPAREEVWDELEEESDFPEKFKLVNGTFQLGSLMPPPNGICTPHLMVLEDAEVEEVIEAVDEVFRLYEEVYESGERIIKEREQ